MPDEDSYYDLPAGPSNRQVLRTLCASHPEGLTSGAHGLPLIGSGDWNDGMNMVGEHGKGESVWLGFFLYDVLMQFAEVARTRGDAAFAERCQRKRRSLRQNIEAAWLGWRVVSPRLLRRRLAARVGQQSRNANRFHFAKLVRALGRGRCDTFTHGMEAVDRRLVRRDDGLIQLLDPPFDKSTVESRLHQGLRPGSERKRRAIHACGASGPPWPSPRWVTASAPGNSCA